MFPNHRRDVESGSHSSLLGYPSLARFIASDSDRTSLVFRRFDRLAARNLLYLQSELAELEGKLVRPSCFFLGHRELMGSYLGAT